METDKTGNTESKIGIRMSDLTNLRIGLKDLGSLKLKNFKLRYAISYNLNKIIKGLVEYQKILEDLKKKYVKKEFLNKQHLGPSDLKSPEKMEELMSLVKESESKPFEEKMFKIKLSTMERENPEGLTALMLTQFAPILTKDIEIPNEI